MCKETGAELARVLSYPKFHLKTADANALLADILPYAEMFVFSESLRPIEGLADDKDAVFLHLAQQAKAEWLVSGDTHLLGLKNPPLNVKVISAADFLRVLDMSEV